MDRWYISDTHFQHENIIKYSSRPFANAREMDEFLKDMWNQTVKPADHITHLGDVTMVRGGRVQREWFRKLIRGLHGHKRLFLGNHDHFPIGVYLEAGFEKIYATWRSQENIIWSHIPLHPRGISNCLANVHGHTHDTPDYEPVVMSVSGRKPLVVPYVNICVEKTGYKPIHLDEVLSRVEKIKEQYLSGKSDTVCDPVEAS